MAGGVIGGLLVLLLAVVFYGGIGWVMTALVCALYDAWPDGSAGSGSRSSPRALVTGPAAPAGLRPSRHRPDPPPPRSPVAGRSRRPDGFPRVSVTGTAW